MSCGYTILKWIHKYLEIKRSLLFLKYTHQQTHKIHKTQHNRLHLYNREPLRCVASSLFLIIYLSILFIRVTVALHEFFPIAAATKTAQINLNLLFVDPLYYRINCCLSRVQLLYIIGDVVSFHLPTLFLENCTFRLSFICFRPVFSSDFVD